MIIDSLVVLLTRFTCPRSYTNFPSTNQPTKQPTNQPSNHPTNQPSNQPTIHPSNHPTNQLTNQPITGVWPKGSPAYASYAGRITGGVNGYTVAQANRLASLR